MTEPDDLYDAAFNSFDSTDPRFTEYRPHITLSSIEPETVSWVWRGRIPVGKLVIIDGDPSTGKSTLCLDIAARITRNEPWPDGVGRPGDNPALGAGVLLLSAEDGMADTIVPRLVAAGADREFVHALTEVTVFDDNDPTPRRVPPQLPRDIPVIRRVIEDESVSLVIVDVLMAYLAGKVDSHRDQDVRGVLHQLSAMAEQTGATILLVRHLNKAGGSNALYRGGGSIGIVGAARSAYLVARDPDEPDRRLFACTKMNIATEPPTLAYRLVSDPDHGCARVAWESGPVDLTAAQLLRIADPDDQDDRNAAQQFLVDYLAGQGGEAAAGDVIKAGRAAGFNENDMKHARKRCHSPRVETRKAGMGGGWVWALDVTFVHEGATEGAEGATQNESAPSAPSGEHVAPSGTKATHQAAGEQCPECGDPLNGPPLMQRCRDNHRQQAA